MPPPRPPRPSVPATRAPATRAPKRPKVDRDAPPEENARPRTRRPAPVAIYGLHAALAVAARRPEAIERVLYAVERRADLGPLLRVTAAARRPYREVPTEELARAAGTLHHEGVVVFAAPPPLRSVAEWLAGPRGRLLVALDEVGNPHNLGAILRSAAWFGASGVLLPSGGRQAGLSPAAMRVAQGAAEVVPLIGAPELAPGLRALSAEGYTVVGADAQAPVTADAYVWPRLVALVLGNEATGLTPAVARACGARVRIDGTGAVESLNVAVAAGVLLAAASRRS